MKTLILILAFIWIAGWCCADDSQKVQDLEKQIEELKKQIAAIEQNSQSAQLDEIKRQIAILAEEVEKMRSGEEETETKLEDAKRRSLGLGPSASTVYTKKQGPSLAGYGEMLYDNTTAEGEPSTIDLVRAVVYVGYRFNDRFLFNSEIEFEHGGSEHGGAAGVEFAHVDFLANEDLTLRGGMVLVPMGLVNEFHEPTVFLGAERPETEDLIIPSTWHENGFGVVGRHGLFDYRAYVINTFNATGFSAEEGLHEGKQDGAEAKLTSPAAVGRLDITPAAGLLLGGSLYGGNSGVLDSDFSVRTIIGEGHVEYRREGWNLRGLYAHASLNNVAQLNEFLGLTGEQSVGSSLAGGYLQAGYQLWTSKSQMASFIPYFRFEKVNTQNTVPAGYAEDPANNRTLYTIGAEFKPISNLVIKSDYEFVDDPANTGVDQFNLLLGYSF